MREVWLHGPERPDTVIDIADVLDLKIAALREHKSQLGPWDPTPFITGWALEQGKPKKLRAAEAFRRMVLEDL